MWLEGKGWPAFSLFLGNPPGSIAGVVWPAAQAQNGKEEIKQDPVISSPSIVRQVPREGALMCNALTLITVTATLTHLLLAADGACCGSVSGTLGVSAFFRAGAPPWERLVADRGGGRVWEGRRRATSLD